MRAGISPLLAFNMGLPRALEALLGDGPAAPVRLRAEPAASAPADPALAGPQPPAGAQTAPATAAFAKFAKVGAPHINVLGAVAPAGEAAGGAAGLDEGGAQQWSDEEAAVLQALQLFFRARRRCGSGAGGCHCWLRGCALAAAAASSGPGRDAPAAPRPAGT
jgi:hypothetical protein